MSQVNITKQHPDVYKQLAALSSAAEAAAAAAGLDGKLIELVKIRVSQLNGCAFCTRLHTREAVELGESTDRLAVLPAWWESQYFSPLEASALGLAEEVTRLSVPARTDWDNDALSEEQVSAVSWLALVMGAWNRVAIRSGYRVAP
ncbi:carboxymuconolactone decarboxylase family protein [Leucobacter komagatae]|uniref:Alkylhydroperoxidase n=1 Tax=Leucobacter komagatae TaxID=55969 RepID=A0A0D0INR5_9MICO|nr:carboxymuconolactone decarboxylase family protein [Leucobacter komagatae]KIP52722.1 alkylhydroperoxidase [Leucobacter komagatae]